MITLFPAFMREKRMTTNQCTSPTGKYRRSVHIGYCEYSGEDTADKPYGKCGKEIRVRKGMVRDRNYCTKHERKTKVKP